MIRFGARRDPWWEDGTGARRDRTRERVVGSTALVLAIAACGLAAAVWIRTLLPMVTQLGLG
jgi:hypothetical protein